jgi:hypothetical protein
MWFDAQRRADRDLNFNNVIVLVVLVIHKLDQFDLF